MLNMVKKNGVASPREGTASAVREAARSGVPGGQIEVHLQCVTGALRVMKRTFPINEEGVDAVLATLSSPVTKNLVRMAVAAARLQFIRKEGQTEDAWLGQLPISEFDMGFLARVVAETFRSEEMLRATLNGSSIEEASGWDV